MLAFDDDDLYLGENPREVKQKVLSTSQILGNRENMEKIISYCRDPDSHKGIILRGYVGCGKIEMIKACVVECGYDFIIYDIDTESDEIYESIINTITSVKGIDKLFKMKQKVIIIRDIDNTMKTSHKKKLYAFLNIAKRLNVPLFITSNDNSVGTVRDVPKSITQMQFERPDIKQLASLFPEKGLSEGRLEEIIVGCGYDIRYIKTLMERDQCQDTHFKYIELDTFRTIEYCLEDHPIGDKIIHCSIYSDSAVFHNYLKLVKKSESMSNLYTVADFCTWSDVFNTYAFDTNVHEVNDEAANIMGTIATLHTIKDSLNERRVGLEYPSSNIGLAFSRNTDMTTDPIRINLLLNVFFTNNKFNGNYRQFEKEIREIKNPMQAFKICFMEKKRNRLANEVRKIIKKIEEN